ncbi:MAG: pyruvate kinase [Candidatus Methylacidiphilales bacterium]|nr:pyruvate kinase [Candidatus Methylacidiphilales bacterium]
MSTRPHVRKTKIIATLGPATESPEMLRKMMETGVNIFRLNMSHGKHEWVREIVPRIREIAESLNLNIGILMDTQGPAIRTGDLPTKLDLKVGDIFTFTVRGVKSEEEYSVDTNYDDLIGSLNIGDTVLVDNGVIHMKVLSKETGRKLVCEVLTPGVMGNRRHINLPGIKVNLPALTEKDLGDVAVGVEMGVDYLALSFVREPDDIKLLRSVLTELGAPEIRIVAKIEDQTAVRNINEIIEQTDAIMVARGDLGIEVPYEELPIIQRRIVKACLKSVKPVIVATHMLESMISNPGPTRAEITDIANAVYEQADAIMLSGETTTGQYPLACVSIMDRIASRIERSGSSVAPAGIVLGTDAERVAASAVHMANEVRAEGICVFTRRGNIAAITAGLRPMFSTVFAFAPTKSLCHRLSLNHGVIAHQVDFHSSPDMNILSAEQKLKDRGLAKAGDKIIVVSDLIVADQFIQSVHLRIIA